MECFFDVILDFPVNVGGADGAGGDSMEIS